MARFDFVGGSYTSQSVNSDCQRCVNWYPEANESGDGKSKMTLLCAPGLLSVCQLPGPTRGQFEFDGVVYAVSTTGFYSIVPTAFDAFGQVSAANAVLLSGATLLANDFQEASLDANENQIIIASGGSVYIYYVNAMNDSVTGLPIAAGTFVLVPPSNFTLSTGNAPVVRVAFCDSFFLALIANSQSVQISNALDGFNWQPLGAIVGGVYTGGVSTQIVVSVFPDNLIGMLVDHRQVILFGRKRIVFYASSGDANIFVPQGGGNIEQGLSSTWSPVVMDNSFFWLGQRTDQGGPIAWRANGYNVIRVSTHATEWKWSTYPKTSDAVSYSYVDQGHTFWMLLFPSANGGLGATWVFDAATNIWHERNAGQDGTGHPSWNHTFANNTHLVGDWQSGNVYQMSINQGTNNGVPINRFRIAPHIAIEREVIRYDKLELDMETGMPNPVIGFPVVLSDLAGHLWEVTVTDTGMLQTVATTAVPQGAVLLTDPTSAATWQLGVSITGMLMTTSAALNVNGPKTLQLVSASGLTGWALGVTAGGALTTSPSFAGSTSSSPRKIFLSYSRDGGHAFSSPQARSFGLAGQYRTRVFWMRLGYGRDCVFRVDCSEPVPIRIVDAYLNATPGYQPTERLAFQARKSA